MKYGFVIDNRKCIGCHACTTACKSEHEVPVGVNRTWVKQVEKGTFPNTRRLFSVMRCNHCTDAPCVDICPTEALYTRSDGIVDFDKDRCIGCKSCMQACPYDALYIDPETHTAAKCNYCAHRVDVGLEPACVNVCPEQAIISGDMHDPTTEIAQLLARQAVKTRKPEKATQPNLFYIDADTASLVPTDTAPASTSLWGAQEYGVGHFAKEAEKLSFSNPDVVAHLTESNTEYNSKEISGPSVKSVDVLMNGPKQVYNTPDKGILWGWEVSAYVWTKAIAAGVILIPIFSHLLGIKTHTNIFLVLAGIVSLIFLTLTGLLLIKDLDQPKRFLYVMLRPHWKSWLVRGGYAISGFGMALTALIILGYSSWSPINNILLFGTAGLAIIVAVYTAYLFNQAKGRDFWQSPILPIHMFLHAIMAGAAAHLFLMIFGLFDTDWHDVLRQISVVAIVCNVIALTIELTLTHPTKDAKHVVSLILSGRYRNLFWIGTILIGNIIPLAMLIFLPPNPIYMSLASVCLLIGIYINNHIWVEAPQRIPLS